MLTAFTVAIYFNAVSSGAILVNKYYSIVWRYFATPHQYPKSQNDYFGAYFNVLPALPCSASKRHNVKVVYGLAFWA